MSILTVAEFREHVTTTLGEDAVQRLLDAAEEAIIERAGPAIDVSGSVITDTTERFNPNGRSLMLGWRAESIVEVIERAQWAVPVTLAADDYELSSSGFLLRRLYTGTHPATHWRPFVDVTYSPFSDLATRERVQIELCRLDIAFNPTLASQTIGAWSETYQTGLPYATQRADILASLHADRILMV